MIFYIYKLNRPKNEMTFAFTFHPNTGYQETESAVEIAQKITKAHEANLKFKRFLDNNRIVFPMDYVPIYILTLMKKYTKHDPIIICLFNDKLSCHRTIHSNLIFTHTSSHEALRFHGLPTNRENMKIVDYVENLSEDSFYFVNK